eukprot:TRINITY_DN8750_c0_g2_i12.p1 TRINITY_DN8750_c0_g2~~TRINITY_DN8750_c0_g2_i12.p1  ORF type:complete len:117 (+),score=11.71 TRINITY_DN8750_c0_g2_i12:429-779(+)
MYRALIKAHRDYKYTVDPQWNHHIHCNYFLLLLPCILSWYQSTVGSLHISTRSSPASEDSLSLSRIFVVILQGDHPRWAIFRSSRNKKQSPPLWSTLSSKIYGHFFRNFSTLKVGH